MGSRIVDMVSRHGNNTLNEITIKKNSVFHLGVAALEKIINDQTTYSHLLAVTSCPDSVAPSLAQMLTQHFFPALHRTHSVDFVQGCTGGVSALILASQISEYNHSNVLVVAADAAQKATSPASDVYHVFKNGVFACCIEKSEDQRRLIYHQSRQYDGLFDVVNIPLGHDADEVISRNLDGVGLDSRKYLGLTLNNIKALKLMREADAFYLEFIETTGHPDILILHQVNVPIINHLEKLFSKYPITFINLAEETGNCGCATTGIVLNLLGEMVVGKRVMICSFGTGGIITAGLWQF